MSNLLSRLPGERISDELDKGLGSSSRIRFLELLYDLGLLRTILPEIDALRRVPQDPAHHPEGDVYMHTLLTVESLDELAETDLVWAALLHDSGKAVTTESVDSKIRSPGHAEAGAQIALEIGRRLAWSSARRDRVVWLVRNHMRLLDSMKMRPGTLRGILAHRWGGDLAELFRASRAASGREDTSPEVAFCLSKVAEYASDGMDELPVCGGDLLDMGVPEGPGVGELLDLIREAWLEGSAPRDRKGLLLYAKELYRSWKGSD